MMTTTRSTVSATAGPLLPAVLLVALLFVCTGTGTAGEPSRNEEVVRSREIEAWRRLADAAQMRYMHWFAYAEITENERCSAVVGLFNVAARSERVLLYHLNQRLETIGANRNRPAYSEYTACYTCDSAIAAAIGLCSGTTDLSPPAEFTHPETGLASALRAASVTPKILGWLAAKLRLMRSKPVDLHWWAREYFVCSLCGMPMDDLRLNACPACGAGETEFLRVR